MKTLVVNRNVVVSIFAAMLLIYGVQGIGYAQGNAPTVIPGENNTSLVVIFPAVCDKDENAYQVQFRQKSPRAEWTTKCVVVDYVSGGGSFFGIVFWGGSGDCVGNYAIFGDLEPGVTYEARYRDTNQSVCVENPLSPDPWSQIGEGTTHLIAPPRVEFVDAALAGAVRGTLGLSSEGEHIDFLKIPKAKLAQLTELDVDGWGVTNLIGLEHATQLTVLVLYDNNVSDLTLLAQLTQLIELDLSYNEISDVTPLAQLTQLTELDLGSNQISDVTPLAQLANSSLTSLRLSGNNISDVTPLAQLANSSLTRLYLSSNQISDVTPLAQLANSSLRQLFLGSNQISDVTPLAQLAQLTTLSVLSLSNNNIRDITPITQLTQLDTLYLSDNPISDTYPLNTLLDANPKIDIDIVVSKEKGGPTITASTLQPLTGLTLDGAKVTLTLSNGEFESSRSTIRPALSISGIPGIGIEEHWGELERVSKTEIEIILTFSGGNIESDSILTLTVEPEAIANYNGPAHTLQVSVPAAAEAELSAALVASTSHQLTTGTLNGGRVTLTLTNGIFTDEWSIARNMQVSGISGVSLRYDTFPTEAVTRVNDTEITIDLTFDGSIDDINKDAKLIFTVEPGVINGYNGPALTAEIPVTATTEIEVTGELVVSTAFPLTETTLNGSIVKLTLKTKSFKGTNYDYDGSFDDESMVATSGILGVNIAHWGWGRYIEILNKKEAFVKLSFDGNLDTDATLTFIVPPYMIENYDGPPLAAALPVTAKTERQVLVSESEQPSMYWVNADTSKIESLEPFNAITNQVVSLFVDKAGGKVYWTERDSSSSGTIKRSNLDGTGVEALLTQPNIPRSIVVDTVRKKLYWINSFETKIQSADMNGENIETVIQLDDDVTSFAIDIEGTKFYWTDPQYSIRRMNLDGTNMETVLHRSTDLTRGWSTDLTRGIGGIAIADGKIYWTEQQVWYRVSGKIHRANLNGTNVETLATPFGNPTGIAVDTLNGKVYWANSFGGLQRLDINGGDIEDVVYGIVAPGSFVLGPVSTQPTIPTTPETPATTDAAVSISPASVVSPAVGEQLEVHLNITGGEDVRGYQATVQFDTTTLRHVESSNGDYLPDGALFISPAVDGNLVKLTATALTGESSGAGTLATLTFEVVVVKASTLTLSNVLLVNNMAESSSPKVEDGQITVPSLNADVNGDGSVDLQDLAIVQSHLGQTGQNKADVNGDGVVDVVDLALVANAIAEGAGASSLHPLSLEMFTTADVRTWLSQAQHLDLTDPRLRKGILFLEQLLVTLLPKETTLLANYPNPFNPETWIPYHLAKDADVTLHIYAVNGTLVRTLTLGHQAAGMYQNRSRAAYWDGKNALGESVASGVYFYTLTADDFTATRKMLIRK